MGSSQAITGHKKISDPPLLARVLPALPGQEVTGVWSSAPWTSAVERQHMRPWRAPRVLASLRSGLNPNSPRSCDPQQLNPSESWFPHMGSRDIKRTNIIGVLGDK